MSALEKEGGRSKPEKNDEDAFDGENNEEEAKGSKSQKFFSFRNPSINIQHNFVPKHAIDNQFWLEKSILSIETLD